ncbi:hypothetical protein ACETAC_08915 [Aceticella autotrophica]|uniref:Uncharacterized protein n=1 Tax=Aceticella autotrophica TaxID=2755338 RepID=A0A975GA69_9THEO|nr:hypothetical protein [Aceticella autotrophica]QSZ26980.1 hypothetical protein ACETAC_08915 [Aceticella autotrophica]
MVDFVVIAFAVFISVELIFHEIKKEFKGDICMYYNKKCRDCGLRK